MNLQKARPVSEEPITRVSAWSILRAFRIDGSTTEHICGTSVSGEARVSSAVQIFDISQMCGISNSGRRYVLYGLPGLDHTSSSTWRKWCEINKITAYVDVTDDYIE
jgi:hypothetical protein